MKIRKHIEVKQQYSPPILKIYEIPVEGLMAESPTGTDDGMGKDPDDTDPENPTDPDPDNPTDPFDPFDPFA